MGCPHTPCRTAGCPETTRLPIYHGSDEIWSIPVDCKHVYLKREQKTKKNAFKLMQHRKTKTQLNCILLSFLPTSNTVVKGAAGKRCVVFEHYCRGATLMCRVMCLGAWGREHACRETGCHVTCVYKLWVVIIPVPTGGGAKSTTKRNAFSLKEHYKKNKQIITPSDLLSLTWVVNDERGS